MNTRKKSDLDLTYVSIPLVELVSGKKLPGAIYLCLGHRMVRYRGQDDELDNADYNKLVYSHVKYVFIEEQDRPAFNSWLDRARKDEQPRIAAAPAAPSAPTAEASPAATPAGSSRAAAEPPSTPASSEDVVSIADAIAEQRRAVMDVFHSPRDDRHVRTAVDTAKKLVTELLHKPYTVSNVQTLQRYSRGILDHSMNVSLLSVFLGLRMGYTHQLILENLAIGGLFHDIGKALIEPKEEGMTTDQDPAMQEHPKLGAELVAKIPDITNEVRMIVAQHHEFLDGTGYPGKLKGLAVYDLARVVAIANIYDNLISQSVGPTIKERATEALNVMEREFQGKLDPKKLEKAIKILRYSFL